MEFIQITSITDDNVQEIFESYCSTFPEDERRDWNSFSLLFSHPKAKIISVLHETKNIGYLIIWELTGYTFVEHFEVFPQFRSQKLGSYITGYLFENHSKLILEIEPEHLGDDAKRRSAFYQRNGFSVIDKMYVQPSYGEGKKPLDLWLLANYLPENLQYIKDEIYTVVYQPI